MARMIRKQIYIERRQQLLLARLAKDRGMSESAIVREALAAHRERGVNPAALRYLNRLSDLLFIVSRAANAGREEPLWKPGASRATCPE